MNADTFNLPNRLNDLWGDCENFHTFSKAIRQLRLVDFFPSQIVGFANLDSPTIDNVLLFPENNYDLSIKLGEIFHYSFNKTPERYMGDETSRYTKAPFHDLLYKYGNRKISSMLANAVTSYLFTNKSLYIFLYYDDRNTSYRYSGINFTETYINQLLYNKFSKKWLGLYDELQEVLDFLNPYQMSVDRTLNSNLYSTNFSAKEITKDTVSTNASETSSNNATDGVYGFNSLSPVNSDTTKGDSSSNGETTSNREYLDSNTADYTRDLGDTETITRKGNIGNHTMYELYKEKLEYLNIKIIDIINNDIGEFLTRNEY